MDKMKVPSLCIKFLNALTGAALLLFLIVHLAGNLTLFARDGGRLFNTYAHHLESAGPALWAAELILLALFLTHAATSVTMYVWKLLARPEAYVMTGSKGGPSRKTLASRSMIITGAVLLVFIPLHVWMFKYGRNIPVTIDGKEMRDLHALVAEAFKNGWIAGAYVGVMAFLGFHLRHGFWSVLQSLGALNARWSPVVYAAGLVFAVLMAGGFLVLPLWLHFCPPGGAP